MQKIQPIEFSGCREEIRAPAVANDIKSTTIPMPRGAGPRGAAVGVDAFRTWNATPAPMAANESVHSDHASREAMRVLI